MKSILRKYIVFAPIIILFVYLSRADNIPFNLFKIDFESLKKFDLSVRAREFIIFFGMGMGERISTWTSSKVDYDVFKRKNISSSKICGFFKALSFYCVLILILTILFVQELNLNLLVLITWVGGFTLGVCLGASAFDIENEDDQ